MQNAAGPHCESDFEDGRENEVQISATRAATWAWAGCEGANATGAGAFSGGAEQSVGCASGADKVAVEAPEIAPDSAPPPAPALAHQPEEAAVAPPAAASSSWSRGGIGIVGSKVKRGERWWRLSIATTFATGEHVGWGGTCGLHTDAASSLECKRQLRFCGESSDDTRCRIKTWLLAGFDIDPNAHNARSHHVSGKHPRHEALMHEEDLDAMLIGMGMDVSASASA